MNATSQQDLEIDGGLPADASAERTILGAILLDNAAHYEAAEKLQAEDFSIDSHRRIFCRMCDLMSAHRAVDIVTLSHELGRHKEVEAVGGVAYLASLTEGLPRRPVIGEYVRIVKDKSLLRRLMEISSMTIARAADQSEDALEIGQAVASQFEAVIAGAATRRLVRAGDYLLKTFPTAEAMVDHAARQQGVKTGFDEFDELTNGFQKGELIIIAARPSMGKTALVVNITEYAGVDCNKTVALYSLEMSKQQILRNMICSRAHVPTRAVKHGHLDRDDLRYFSDAKRDVEEAPIFIDDGSDLTLGQLRGSLKQLTTMGPLDLVQIDYLQLMSTEGAPRKYNRDQELGWLTKGLKALAKELDVPVVLLCQLSRANTARAEKRPMLSDLRESGSIEQDADLVAFPHRPSYYEPKGADSKEKDEIIIGKQRNGPVGTAHVMYNPPILRWSDPSKFREQTDFSFEWGGRG